jgi:hypothetical protein
VKYGSPGPDGKGRVRHGRIWTVRYGRRSGIEQVDEAVEVSALREVGFGLAVAARMLWVGLDVVRQEVCSG